MKLILIIILIFCLGFAIGGLLFCKVQPRSIFSRLKCEQCFLIDHKEVKGMLASLGFQFTPNWAPRWITSTEKCVVIKHPRPIGEYHVVAFPRKDIKNIGEMNQEDIPFVVDCLLTLQKLIQENHLRNYRIFTNGPDIQEVTLLHFHLVSNEFSSLKF